MDNSPYYPNSITDQNFNQANSCKNGCKPKPTFDGNKIYPQNYDNTYGQNAQDQYYQTQNYQGQNYQNQYYQEPKQQTQYFQQDPSQQIYPNASMGTQKNMFGSLNPQQLMSLISSKGNLTQMLDSIKGTNPQLAMLLGLMKNMPMASKQSKDQKQEKQQNKTYTKVKDYYKEDDEKE